MTDNSSPDWPCQHRQRLPCRPLNVHRSEPHRGSLTVEGSPNVDYCVNVITQRRKGEMFLFGEASELFLLSLDRSIYSITNPFSVSVSAPTLYVAV
jgi:hypothetical protein